MAVAKLVCGDCGAVLSPADVRCPSCGASIETERVVLPPASPAPAVRCTVCGHQNGPGAEFCQSCGARLPGGSPVRREKAGKPPAQARKQGPGQQKSAAPGAARLWQTISVVAVLAFIGYVVYIQVRSEKSSPASGTAEESGAPQGGSPLGAIGMESVDLKPLEDAVRQNPSDPAAQIRLANALHDNHMLPRAVEAYKKYLAMRPRDPDARTDLGICYFQQAQADSLHRESLLHEAASAMEEAFKGAPKPHQPSAFNLGVVYLHLSDMEQSTTWFRKAVEINPESDLGKRAQNMITQHTVPQ